MENQWPVDNPQRDALSGAQEEVLHPDISLECLPLDHHGTTQHLFNTFYSWDHFSQDDDALWTFEEQDTALHRKQDMGLLDDARRDRDNRSSHEFIQETPITPSRKRKIDFENGDTTYFNTCDPKVGREVASEASGPTCDEEGPTDSEGEHSDTLVCMGNPLLLQRLQQAASAGNETARRWLKKRFRPRRKDHCLFQPGTPRKPKRKKRTAAMVSKMSPKAEDLMRKANNAYLECRLSDAILLLEEAIKVAPGVHDPFHVLGLLYEEDLHDLQKALDCYLVAAYLLPDDYTIWRRVAILSKELGHTKQAIVAYEKALRNDESQDTQVDAPLIFDLASCYITEKKFRNAVTHLTFLSLRHPGDVDIGLQLAKCYCELKQFQKAAETLFSCVTCHVPPPTSLETKLKKDYFADLKRSHVFHHAQVLIMLSTVLIRLKHYDQCETLLLHVINEKTVPGSIPLKLWVYLGACQLYLGRAPTSYFIEKSLTLLLQSPEPKTQLFPLYVLLIDALYSVGKPKEVLTLFTQISHLEEIRANASLWAKVARCQLQQATVSLPSSDQPLGLLPSTVSHAPNETTQAKLLLSEITTKLGRTWDVGSALCSLMTATSLLDQPDTLSSTVVNPSLPPALPYGVRLGRLRELQHEMTLMLELCGRESSLSADEEQHRFKWIEKFLNLVQDSELDTHRILRYTTKRRLDQLELDAETQNLLVSQLKLHTIEHENEGESTQCVESNPCSTALCDERTTKSLYSQSETSLETSPDRFLLCSETQRTTYHSNYVKIKESLGLISLETILGWKDYASFLESAMGMIMRSAGMHRQAVELLEAILENKRLLRIQQQDLVRRDFFQKIQQLSLELAMEGELYRLALLRIRQKYALEPEHSNQCLEAIGTLLFSRGAVHKTRGGMPSLVEKDALLEARAWCIRQLLQRPHHFLLTLLAGHFCNASGRSRFSVEEYVRAHRLDPQDDLSRLALATSLLNLAVSRIVKDRHGTLVRGLAMMSSYGTQRQRTSAELQRDVGQWNGDGLLPDGMMQRIVAVVFSCEICYNKARAYHQNSLFHLAVPLYLKCIHFLNAQEIQQGLERVDSMDSVYCKKDRSYGVELLRTKNAMRVASKTTSDVASLNPSSQYCASSMGKGQFQRLIHSRVGKEASFHSTGEA